MALVPSIDSAGGTRSTPTVGGGSVVGAGNPAGGLGRTAPIRVGTSGLTHTGAPDAIHKPLAGVVTHGAIRAAQGIPTPRGGRAHKLENKGKPGKAVPRPKGHHVTSTHRTRSKSVTGHKTAVARPRPKAHPPAVKPTVKPKAAPKSAGVSTPTNSPAPVNGPSDSGGLFAGLDLFPLLLLAGGALALWWLYTHRKR